MENVVVDFFVFTPLTWACVHLQRHTIQRQLDDFWRFTHSHSQTTEASVEQSCIQMSRVFACTFSKHTNTHRSATNTTMANSTRVYTQHTVFAALAISWIVVPNRAKNFVIRFLFGEPYRTTLIVNHTIKSSRRVLFILLAISENSIVLTQWVKI